MAASNATGGHKSPAQLDELETHLRQDIRALMTAGKPEAEAFQLASSRLGDPACMGAEFKKIKSGHIWPVRISTVLWFALTVTMALTLSLSKRRSNEAIVVGHVLFLTSGYIAALAAGFLGICHVCYRASRTLTPVRQESLRRGLIWFCHLAAGLVVVAVLLGMAWRRIYVGRYFAAAGPRELLQFGAWCVCAWFIGLPAMQRFELLQDRATMLMGIAGNIIVCLAWFGPYLMVIPHWPFTLTVFLAIAIHVCFLLLGLTPDSEARPNNA